MTTTDLHLHTNYSDGRLPPKEVLNLAYKNNLRCVAITDHDTIDGYKEAKALSLPPDLTLVPGVEITFWTNYAAFHVLVFNFNEEKMEDFLNRDRWMAEYLQKKSRKNKKKVKELEKATTLKGALALLRKTGGKLFLAHPFRYTQNKEEVEKIITLFEEAGIHGIECYHPSADQVRIAFLEEEARKRGMLICGGSDFHGTMGRGLLASTGAVEDYHEEEIDKWLEK